MVTAMYPDELDPARGVFVQREVDALRASGLDVQVIDKKKGIRAYISFFLRAAREIRRNRFDIIHAHYGTSSLVLLAPSRAQKVVTFHGSDIALGGRPRWSKFWLQYLVSLAGAYFAQTIIIQAPFMRERLPRRTRQKALVLPQSVDLKTFHPPHEQGNRRSEVLFLARRRVPLKRFWLLEEAMNSWRAEPRPRVVTFEDLDLEEVPIAMRESAVGVLTSERETGPLSVKEAIASGLPIAAVDIPATRFLARLFPKFVHLVEASPSALAGCLSELLRRPLPTEAEVAEARAEFRRLGWDSEGHLRKLLSVYQLGE